MQHILKTLSNSLGAVTKWEVLSVFALLLSAREHPADVSRLRAEMILARVHLIAGAFSALTLLWIAVDAFAFPTEVWQTLAVGRAMTAGALLFLAYISNKPGEMTDARLCAAFMFAIPTLFYAACYPYLSDFETMGWAKTVFTGYALLPFIVIAGLSILPISLAEALAFAAPLLLANSAIHIFLVDVENIYTLTGILWLLVLAAAVSAIAGVSQLQLIIEIARQAAVDPLTHAMVRRIGQQVLENQFNVADRQKSALAVAFADIDDFKSVNDRFGHDEGDRILRQAADHLSQHLRRADVLVRWGGEEFVILLPGTDTDGARQVAARIFEEGLGERPEGRALTISMGIAEIQADEPESWSDLVALADERMYQAKKNGKNRFVLPNG